MNYLPIDYGCVAANQVKKNIRDCIRQESEFYAQQQKPTVLEQILLELKGKNLPTTDNLIDFAVPVQSRQPISDNLPVNILGMSPLLQDGSLPEPTIFDIVNMQDSEEEEGLSNQQRIQSILQEIEERQIRIGNNQDSGSRDGNSPTSVNSNVSISRGELGGIEASLRRRGYSPQEITDILLTYANVDEIENWLEDS